LVIQIDDGAKVEKEGVLLPRISRILFEIQMNLNKARIGTNQVIQQYDNELILKFLSNSIAKKYQSIA
jgi:hypothetical protein